MTADKIYLIIVNLIFAIAVLAFALLLVNIVIDLIKLFGYVADVLIVAGRIIFALLKKINNLLQKNI